MKFIIPLIPVGQRRARHGVVAGRAMTYKDPKQRHEEGSLNAFLAQHQPQEPLDGPVLLGVKAFMPIPKSKPKKWQAAAMSGAVRPVTKPDLDNILKHVKDCLSTMRYWQDDRQVVGYIEGTGKYYSQNPRYEVEIRPAGGL
jgi:Holliday junction resolvase RusA-like endonuclease